jgi:S-adenosylmethionine:tRNA ribosyltransferase-isomerase
MPDYDIEQFDYYLPENYIAESPLQERDQSKLLVYEGRKIEHTNFKNIVQYLPGNSALVFNDTKVIRARLFFKRESGALIEVFCLRPLEPYPEITQAMQQKSGVIWQCFAGNQRRWKIGEKIRLEFEGGNLVADLIEKAGREVKVHFTWNPGKLTFSQVIDLAGRIPLPPYIHRELRLEDEFQYQTVYAQKGGAVAAPTAGLHFTKSLIEEIKENHQVINITLHVSAGTFQPVEETDIRNHKMHVEEIIFSRNTIREIIKNAGNIIAVGTTSLRALESLYWFGFKLIMEPEQTHFFVDKLYPYGKAENISISDSLEQILKWMDRKGILEIYGFTEIMIMPGYNFKICKGLITNFHLPKSSLLMLIAAFIGEDWIKIYQEAIENKYRFLSFGDASLLLPGQKD